MADTPHHRVVVASIGGLVLQTLAGAGIVLLGQYTASLAMTHLGWMALGGAILWLASLLVFRQMELVVLEDRDLDQLRREKTAMGTAESIFAGEGPGALGFRVAAARLAWMQRWLVPVFGLLAAAYLVAVGVWRWGRATSLPLSSESWPPVQEGGLLLVVSSLLIFALFLYSRYAAGLGRMAEWTYLRACGGYMLGIACGAFALVIALGINEYAQSPWWEHLLARLLPAVMVLLGAEFALNFVADIYRPRQAGVAARACFDSRLLALISEPGGLAHALAEAINYQFGFQVSHTWFYRLMVRALIPLTGLCVVVLWLMTCLVIVNPFELAVIERFGRQLNAENPLGPGLHVKLPWPFDEARKYRTGQPHQIIVGAKYMERGEHRFELSDVVVWTDNSHAKEHYNFIFAPAAQPGAATSAPAGDAADEKDKGVPVDILRMSLAVQYRIRGDALPAFTATMADDRVSREPLTHTFVESCAWNELIRFNAATRAEAMLGERRVAAGETIRKRLNERFAALGLGVDVIYVGLQHVHPEASVGKAFAKVAEAEQEKITAIRQAHGKENQLLSAAAGSRQKALALAEALGYREQFDARLNRASQQQSAADAARLQPLRDALDARRPDFLRRIEADHAADRARSAATDLREQVQLGLGGNTARLADAEQRSAAAAQAAARAADELRGAAQAARTAAGLQVSDDELARAAEVAEARVGLDYWESSLTGTFAELEGDAAAVLAAAQATRWRTENETAAQLARVDNERFAYEASPEIYRARRYLQVLAEGLSKSRKFLLGFDPKDRKIHLRIEAQDVGATRIEDMPTRIKAE
ncbi:MAG: hypothetical protein CHACPFDD_02174 [Phycisphaerae bacterium]|nr:hypothetical protein [Phycisphaerae bacterium]